MQQSKYIGPVQDGKVVQKTAVTYAYGDLLPLMKAIRDLNIAEILAKVVKEYSTIVLTMAINKIISSEAMEPWYEDSYLSRLHRIDISSSSISKAKEAIGAMNLNNLFLKEMLKITGDSDVLCHHLMLPSPFPVCLAYAISNICVTKFPVYTVKSNTAYDLGSLAIHYCIYSHGVLIT